VIVHPGDIILGDREGIVVIARRFAAAVADATDEYELNATLEAWAEDRGDKRSPAKDRVFEDRFLADGGVFFDSTNDFNG
jgi:hypothetical protein